MDDAEKTPNEKLRYERLRRGWSQKKIAFDIDISKDVISRWETGERMPSPYYQEKLCLLFGKNAEELGFLKTKPRTNMLPVNTPTTQNTEILPLLTHAISQGIIAATTELGEKQDMDKLRRELMELALGLTGSVVFSPLSASIATEDFLAQCAASIKGCWYLMRGKGLAIAEEILSTTLPALVKLAVQPSKNQQQAARIATEACMIRAIIAKHRLNFALREISCKEAVQFSHYTQDSTLQAAALMYLGYTYIFAPPLRPKKAVETFLEALEILGSTAPLLKSDICMGLSDAYAQCKEEKLSHYYTQLAQESYPTHPELDPSNLYADCALDTVYQWEAKAYLSLAMYYPDRDYYQKAWDALDRSVKVQAISERCSMETLIYQADAARGLGDLDLYTNSLRKGIAMALEIGSQLRYQDAFNIYQRTPDKWRSERQIQALAHDGFFRLSEGRNG